MTALKLTHRNKKFKFRCLKKSDLSWLDNNFAEKIEKSGLINLKTKLTDLDNYPILANTLFEVMYHLLKDPNCKNKENFEKEFGVKYFDVAKLYKTLTYILDTFEHKQKRSNLLKKYLRFL